MGRFVYIKNNKTKAHQGGHWSEKKRMEVLSLWIATGSPTTVAQQTGVPLATIEAWKLQDWWKKGVESVRNEETDVLDKKLSKALDLALESVMDRIEKGEYIYDQKTGKVKRMPVKLRDVNHAFNTIIDKRQLIRKLPTKIVEASQTEAKLQQLAQQFADFTKKSLGQKEEKVIEFIEGETVIQNEDGVYELKE